MVVHVSWAHRSLRRDERGMALVLSLVAIVVIGALVGGMMTAGRMEAVGGRSNVSALQAHEMAETGLTTAFVNWDVNWNSMALEESATVGPVTSASNRYTYTVTKLAGSLYQINALGERLDISGNVLASRSLARLARADAPDVDVGAAVEGLGDVRVGGTSAVSGIDTNPAGWGAGACTGPLDDVAGIRASQDVEINGAGATVNGDPPFVENDTSVTASRFTSLYNQLLPAVTKTVGSGVYSPLPDTTLTDPGVCLRSLATNWGEPGNPANAPHWTPCRSFMPVVLVTGNLTLNTGRGQGVLIVQGDLRIQGTFIYAGIILATGNVEFHGAGGQNSRIYGAIFAANSTDVNDDNTIIGAPVITYSSCAIQAVLNAAATGVPLADRSWAQIF